MNEAYFNLKLKLEELGYKNTLPIEAVPLVECVLADLLQTTRSLQHYMDLAQNALKQRDNLLVQAEPYKCENIKLLKENTQVHKDLIDLKEDYDKQCKESKRKILSMTDELMKKDSTISKLQHDMRDLSLRGLCADTQSSRNRNRRKDAGEMPTKVCICKEPNASNLEKDIEELTKTIESLELKNEEYYDEISLLKDKIENREQEIIRLSMLLDGGRPFNAVVKDACNVNHDVRAQELIKQLTVIESTNDILQKEIDKGLDKQHEAMLRALNLAEKNKSLQEELKKVDLLALKVEEDCNSRISLMLNDINYLQDKLESMTLKNSELEKDLAKFKITSGDVEKYQESLINVTKEKEALQKEIESLKVINKNLEEKQLVSTRTNQKLKSRPISDFEFMKESQKCPLRNEIQALLEKERKRYEKNISDMQAKLSETLNNFNKHLSKCNKTSPRGSPQHRGNTCDERAFVKHLHNKLCESEQKILMLKKENNDYKMRIESQAQGDHLNYKDVISQLNSENAELSKENISLSQQLSHYKNLGRCTSENEYTKKEVTKLRNEIESLTRKLQLLKKDNHEYNFRCKEALDMTDKLKRDLVYKQKEIERLEEENGSYKMTHRNGRASADHLKEECNFLREQIKKMQSDVIREKTLASQIKNVQLETERSSNEVQNELLCVQKKLHLSKDTIEGLERKCKDLQSEIISLKNDKSNLIDNIKKIDQERDKLVIELDHKVEKNSVLEQKLKSQSYEICKLEGEITELKRKLNINKVAEHKLTDNEAQIAFLNGEISRLQQKLESAIIENKHMQNSLADANGTLKITKIEYEKSRKEVDGLRQQLQHYVAEVRRIEELMSQKEAERSDMLEHFASLSVEANILENTNHSLESESASKTLQLQSYISKIENLEAKLQDKESIIDSQSTRIATLTCKVSSLENEIKLITEEKTIHEHNVVCLKQMCSSLNTEHANLTSGMGDIDSELKLYENKIKTLTKAKAKAEVERDDMRETLMTTESLLSNTRKEVIDLKLALQDATTETQSLRECINANRKKDRDFRQESLRREELELPLTLEETLHETSHEDDEDSPHGVRPYSKFSYSSTL